MAYDVSPYLLLPRCDLPTACRQIRQAKGNENTNRLLRQYFPKGIDLSVYSQAQLNKVARELAPLPWCD